MANAAIVPAKPYQVLCDTDDEKIWLANRDVGIGASEIAAILGMDGRSSAFKVYCEKVGELAPEDLSDVEAIDWGHRMEPVIAQAFHERTGRRVVRGRRHRFGTLQSTEHPWALASLDYWTSDSDNDDFWPLEIKNVTAFKAEDWLDGTPEYYVAQLHQQMLVTGARRGTSACCLGGNRLLWCDVDRDDRLIRKIVYHGELFWQRVVQRERPEIDGSAATKEVLKRLYPQDDGSTVELPMALADVIDEWRTLKAEAKGTDKRITALENQIKAELGEAQIGILPTGDSVSWKTQQVREHLVRAGTKRPLLYHPAKGQ